MRKLLAALLLVALPAFAQYTPSAGMNTPAAAYEQMRDDKTGEVKLQKREAPINKDGHGNARGNQYDLAVDGAFDGQTVLIIDQGNYTKANVPKALREKGFSSVVYPAGSTPSPEALKQALQKSCEFWLVSGTAEQLTEEHIALIKAFFDAGHGVYIFGDNDPHYVDANRLASALVPGLRMEGNLAGGSVMGIADGNGKSGVRAGHLITTGLEHLFEGVTIATVQFTKSEGRNAALYDGEGGRARAPKLPEGFTPLLYGSGGNLVTVAYEKDGKRLVMDGGFTRLYVSWDDAGTARYVKNAASWLVHAERFKDTVAKRNN